MHKDSGQSLSAFTAVVAVALFLVAGLVIDGGAQLAAMSRAESIAANAVRVAADASATATVEGESGAPEGRSAAMRYLSTQKDVVGDVQFDADGSITVTVRITQDTVFLSLIGMTTVDAAASASGRLYA